RGVGTNTLTVEGGRPLKGAAFALGPDHIEIGSFIGLAAVTNGAITIEGLRGDDRRATLLAAERLGGRPGLDRTTRAGAAGPERPAPRQCGAESSKAPPSGRGWRCCSRPWRRRASR